MADIGPALLSMIACDIVWMSVDCGSFSGSSFAC